jgi:Tat protein translocase TatC
MARQKKLDQPRLPDPADDPHGVRMSIGEHLDELRACIVRSLLAIVAACLICIWPAKYMLALTVQPLRIALLNNGQPDSLLGTSPTEPLIWYAKIVVFLGLVLASPVVIHQIWSFLAKGLYQREKKWVYRLVPVSVGLFIGGVVFMYLFVLLLSLNFLIGFGSWLPLPSAEPTAIQQLLGIEAPPEATSQPTDFETPEVPRMTVDPTEPPAGYVWFNLFEHKLKFQGDEHVYSVQMRRDDKQSLVTMHMKIGDYLTFVLMLAIAFGLAFQIPLVVVFLTRTGIVPHATLRRYRKGVILTIVIIAGMIAPPDLISHLLLSVPMFLLFEIGMAIGKPKPAADQFPGTAP